MVTALIVLTFLLQPTAALSDPNQDAPQTGMGTAPKPKYAASFQVGSGAWLRSAWLRSTEPAVSAAMASPPKDPGVVADRRKLRGPFPANAK